MYNKHGSRVAALACVLQRVEGRDGGGGGDKGAVGWFRIDPSALSALPARTVEKVLHLYSLGHPSSLNVSLCLADGWLFPTSTPLSTAARYL